MSTGRAWGWRRFVRRTKTLFRSGSTKSEEPVKPEHRTPNVQLLGFRAINRVCDVCFDPTDLASAPAGFFSITRKG